MAHSVPTVRCYDQILEAERERVLARFTRGSHSRDTQGLGLGLSMAKAIAQAHGARLLLSDNRPGLCATIEWPVSGNASQRSEEHTSELQSLMRTSYAVFCLKKKQKNTMTTV